MKNFFLQKTRIAFSTLLAVGLAASVLFAVIPANAQDYPDASDDSYQPQELDTMLAPIALYPDPLLAQVLPAATFPDQIDEAARLVRAGIDPNAIDAQPWDISVKAIAHYPTILFMLADRLDWTTDLGDAYANQPDDVVSAVQRLRSEALAAGNLQSTAQQQIVQDENGIEIWPAQPQAIYVPSYDPDAVYTSGYWFGPAISFGVAFSIGGWLDNDFDWGHHRVYRHGWNENHGWVARSRPFVHNTRSFSGNTNQTVTGNQNAAHHGGNGGHHNQGASTSTAAGNTATTGGNTWGQHNHHNNNGVAASTAGINPATSSTVTSNNTANTGGTHHHFQAATTSTTTASSGTPTNRIIQRNINTSDPKLENFRGRDNQSQQGTNSQQQIEQQQAQAHALQQQQQQMQHQQQEQAQIRAQQQQQQEQAQIHAQQAQQQQQQQQMQHQQEQAQIHAQQAQQQAEQRAHEAQQQAQHQQQMAQQLAQQAQQQAQQRAQQAQQQAAQHQQQNNAFQQSHSGFNPHEESHRGQESRNGSQGQGHGQHNSDDKDKDKNKQQ